MVTVVIRRGNSATMTNETRNITRTVASTTNNSSHSFRMHKIVAIAVMMFSQVITPATATLPLLLQLLLRRVLLWLLFQ